MSSPMPSPPGDVRENDENHDSNAGPVQAASLFQNGNDDWHRAREAGRNASNPIDDDVLGEIHFHDSDADETQTNPSSDQHSDGDDTKPGTAQSSRDENKPGDEEDQLKRIELMQNFVSFLPSWGELSPEHADFANRLAQLIRNPNASPTAAVQLMLEMRLLFN